MPYENRVRCRDRLIDAGTLRDTLVGQVPLALRATTDVPVVLLGVGLALVVIRSLGDLRDHPIVLIPDAVVLAAFAATGASVGYEAGLTPFGIVVRAAPTAVGGGSLCDLLLARVLVVLREGFYATPAVIGGVAFWIAVSVGVRTGFATIGCAGLVLALRRGWRLPTV